MVSGISALAIDAGSDRVDGALFLAILDFIDSKLVRDAIICFAWCGAGERCILRLSPA
jgi:hypothetical protein